MTKRLWQLIPIILIFYLFTSCTSSKYTLPVSTTIEQELVAIEAKAPSVQEHVDVIRDELPNVAEMEKEVSSLEKYLPWVIVLASLGYGVWGYSTQDIEDTISGAVGCFCGIALAVFWKWVAWAGLLALLIFIAIWAITMHDVKKSKRINKE